MANQRVTRSTLRGVNMDDRRLSRTDLQTEETLMSVPRARRGAMQSLRRMPYPPPSINSSNNVPPMRLRARPNNRSVQERDTEILAKPYSLCGTETSVTRKPVRIECPPSPTLLPCPICFAEMSPSSGRPIGCLRCGHVFCRDCLSRALTLNSTCPICMDHVNPGDIRPIYLQ